MRSVSPRKTVVRGEVCWYVRKPKAMGGTRRFFRSETKARDYAKSLNTDAQEAGAPLLSLSRSDQVALVRLVQDFGHNVPELVRSAHAGRVTTKDISLADLALECVQSRRAANESPYYCDQLKRSLDRFNRDCGASMLSQVNQATVRKWLDGLKVSAVTKRGYLTDVKTLLNYAVQSGRILVSPAALIKRPKADAWVPPPILSIKDAAKLMVWLRKHDPGLVVWAAVQLFGGLRKSEAQRLRKEHIGTDQIRVLGKGRQMRHVEITETLAYWLATKPVQLPPKGANKRLRRAGVALPRNVLRHSFCSYAMPIRGARWTSVNAGHSEAMLFRHYRNPEVESPERFWLIR